MKRITLKFIVSSAFLILASGNVKAQQELGIDKEHMPYSDSVTIVGDHKPAPCKLMYTQFQVVHNLPVHPVEEKTISQARSAGLSFDYSLDKDNEMRIMMSLRKRLLVKLIASLAVAGK